MISSNSDFWIELLRFLAPAAIFARDSILVGVIAAIIGGAYAYNKFRDAERAFVETGFAQDKGGGIDSRMAKKMRRLLLYYCIYLCYQILQSVLTVTDVPILTSLDFALQIVFGTIMLLAILSVEFNLLRRSIDPENKKPYSERRERMAERFKKRSLAYSDVLLIVPAAVLVNYGSAILIFLLRGV